MNFDEISLVVPYIERAFLTGIDLNANQPAEPRAFKAHLSWNEIPKGGRYIVSIRNPEDVAVSLFYFLEGHTFERGSISFTAFVRGAVIATNRYWSHLASWLEHQNDPSVLLLSFERMIGGLSSTVESISAFLGFDPDPELLSIVTEQASFAFMRKNHEKFDDRTTTELVDRYCELPQSDYVGKIRAGPQRSVTGRVTDDMRSELHDIWTREIYSRFGFPDYQSLIDAL